MNEALVYFADKTLTVIWLSDTFDDKLRKNYLVKLEADEASRLANGKIFVEGLHPADDALRSVNLFLTVPPGWVSDRNLVARAARLWQRLDRDDAEILNEALWDSRQFYHYLTKSSDSRASGDPHAGFRQRVKLAERAAQLSPPEAVSAAITAALLGAEDHLTPSATNFGRTAV